MVKEAVQGLKSKWSVSAMFMVALMFVMATSAFAAAPEVVIDTSQVESTFGSIGKAVIGLIAIIGATAASIMAIMLGWKYGRKVFGMVGK